MGGRGPAATVAEAARLLGYDLEGRQLRKWPELGAKGDFERWERMPRVKKPARMLEYSRAHLSVLFKKPLSPPAQPPGPQA